MKYTNLFLFLLISTFFTNCSNVSPEKLHGKWEAVSIMEEGQSLDVDYPVVQLEIFDNGTYRYSGTLTYKEAGTWHIKSKYLFTKDTLKPNTIEKAVLISALSIDSFEMEMVENEKERVMTMVRVGSE